MLDEKELKLRLREIADDDYKAPTRPEIYPLVLAMGTHMGSIDPELRDELIFNTLAIWIWEDVFDPRDLYEILKVVLNDQHLFYGLGETESDTVFARSFSMLILRSILNAHIRHPFLPDDELQVIKRKILRYIANEKDLRGYVPEKGWAHAIAHTADALDELVQCDTFVEADLLEILKAMREIIAAGDSVYICEEDERLATAVISTWQREEITNEIIVQWFESFIPIAESRQSQPEGYRRFVNSKNFLRSLFFRAPKAELSEPVQLAINKTLAAFNLFEN